MGVGKMKGRRRLAGWALLFALFLTAAPGTVAATQEGGDGASDREPVIMTILDDEAVMLVTKVDGRDVVRVFGRTQVEHGTRSAWADELVYEEAAGRATLTGDVELVDEGEDGLDLTAQKVELDLNVDAATATGGVRFRRGDATGAADELYYGTYEDLRFVIEAELAARSEVVRRAVEETLRSFRDDDKVLVLKGRVDVKDGEREFQSEFVVINTRDDATVSLGRSAARLPGPEEGNE